MGSPYVVVVRADGGIDDVWFAPVDGPRVEAALCGLGWDVERVGPRPPGLVGWLRGAASVLVLLAFLVAVIWMGGQI